MQAQHANRAKTTFLSNMSHDIRTPMKLTESGFLVETAPDGTDAVAMVEQSEENYYGKKPI